LVWVHALHPLDDGIGLDAGPYASDFAPSGDGGEELGLDFENLLAGGGFGWLQGVDLDAAFGQEGGRWQVIFGAFGADFALPLVALILPAHKSKSPMLDGFDGSGAPPPSMGDSVLMVEVIMQDGYDRFVELSRAGYHMPDHPSG